MTDRVRVWCLRHAESEANAKLPRAVEDCGLTQLGRRQAIGAAQQLAAQPIARIYSSTALRARQTAELIAAALATTPGTLGPPGPFITAMPELVEVDCTADALRAWVVEGDLGRRTADGVDRVDGETGQQVVARVTAAFRQIASAHPGETVAVVGHVASLTVALGRLCALGPGAWGTPLPHARPFLVEWDDHAWHCPAWPAMPPVA
jgi:alpha-ribazole phosphatase/probable phosphoglycerate mutase